ncbi:MAG: type I methionyl aminopeptidase [Deltaproteobacteria bacterium]|nr:type I methionyl aminopeptidase [Deltaproteobacteria bacterium]
MVILKTAEEIERIKEASVIVATVLQKLQREIRPAVTTRDLDKYAEELAISEGAVPLFKGYHGYPSALCISVNEEVIHGLPSSRKIARGDIVSLDFGVLYNGFCGDAAITVAVGDVSPQIRRLLDVTQNALDAAIATAKVGCRLGDISAAVQGCAEKAGFSVVRDFVGHGIGRKMHEDPAVPNFGKRGSGIPLREGMVLAIEPMVNEGLSEVKVLSDGWTVVTADGRLSAHFEHTVAITKDGPEILSRL